MSVVITLYSELGDPLPEAEWDHALRYEVARIANDRAVISSSLCLRRLPEGGLAILFVLKTDRISDPARDDILDEEPLALLYRRGAVGTDAPGVFSDRVDFPRDFSHLNPVPSTSPASICLAREGLQALYERSGVGGVIERLRDWLRDAKTDSLNRDGWEPVPVAANAGVGFIDGAQFQTFAGKNGNYPGWAWGVAMCAGDADFFYFPHQSLQMPTQVPVLPMEKLSHVARATVRDMVFHEPVPLLYLWQENFAGETKAVFQKYERLEELEDDLKRLALHAKFDSAMSLLVSAKWRRPARLPWTAVLLVGVRRALPIVNGRFGLALDREARRLEVKAFSIQASSKKGLREKNATVREVALMPSLSCGLLADVSGIQPKRGACVVGYGALGSTIAEFLARMGVQDISTIDGDVLLAHNLARHNATLLSLGLPKAKAIRHLDLMLRLPDERRFRGYVGDIVQLSAANIAQCLDRPALLIDATASDRVRRTLPRKARQLSTRIVRAELFDEGRLGVLSVEGKDGNPDLLDLYYTLCQFGTESEVVKGWLRGERGRKSDLRTVAAGFSCASATLRMPHWKIASHAAAFMPQLTELIEGNDIEAGIGLNTLCDKGSPVGWQWHAVPLSDVYHLRDFPGWEIRVAPNVLPLMRAMSEERSPKETGGYLYGGWNLDLKRITITAVTPEPPGTAASPAALQLGCAGKTAEERRIRRYCGGRIDLVGTWHSHPNGSAQMSSRDERTLVMFQRENKKRGLPTLLLICGATAIGVHLEL